MNFSFNLDFLFEENIRKFSVASEDITYSKGITYAVYSGNIQFLVVITGSGWWRLQPRGIQMGEQMYSSVTRLNSFRGQADGNLMRCSHCPAHNRAQLQVAMGDGRHGNHRRFCGKNVRSPVVLEEEVKIVKSEATDVMGLSIPDDMIALMQNVAYMRQIKSMSESTLGSRT